MALESLLTKEIEAGECCTTADSGIDSCCAPGPVLGMAVESAETLAQLFKAISSPVRVQMLDILSRHAGRSASATSKVSSISPSRRFPIIWACYAKPVWWRVSNGGCGLFTLCVLLRWNRCGAGWRA